MKLLFNSVRDVKRNKYQSRYKRNVAVRVRGIWTVSSNICLVTGRDCKFTDFFNYWQFDEMFDQYQFTGNSSLFLILHRAINIENKTQ